MATNAVPIAAGFVLFGETLPHGMRAVVLQVAAFACLVASAVALGRQQAPQATGLISRLRALTVSGKGPHKASVGRHLDQDPDQGA